MSELAHFVDRNSQYVRLQPGETLAATYLGYKIMANQFDPTKEMNLKRTFRRASCLVSRLAANMGVRGSTPILSRFRSPVDSPRADPRWLSGLYLDVPEEWDDPYRFFRW